MSRSGRQVRESVRQASESVDESTVHPQGFPASRGVGAVALAATATVGALWGGSAYGKGNIKVQNVAAGSAKVQINGRNTTITAGNRTIINYSKFDIAANESVRFVQPGRQSTVLNRINSADPSHIDGRLTANGIVYFVNPSGVVFGANAVVNVGTLYAAAAGITNSDFLANVNHFTSDGASGGLVANGGVIKAQQVYLIGRQVSNTGAIMADKVVTMAAGNDVLIGDASGGVFVNVAPVTKNAAAATPHVGLGAGDMYSIAVRNTGTVKAPSITLQTASGGAAAVSGTLDASNTHGGKVGGSITVTGGDVSLTGATIDASGSAGGGDVKIGGDFHGAGATATASNTTVDAASSIHADALKNGTGGKVVVWSDNATDFHGSLTARGGEKGGNGGQAEVSGHDLNMTGTADLTAPKGHVGSLLLDPVDINIDVAADVTSLLGLLGLSDTTLSATNDISITTAITTALTNALILQAGHDVKISAPLSLAGKLDVTAVHNVTVAAGSAITALGDLSLSAGGTLGVSSLVKSSTGNVTLKANTAGGTGEKLDMTGGGAVTSLLGDVTVTVNKNLPAPAGNGDAILGAIQGKVVSVTNLGTGGNLTSADAAGILTGSTSVTLVAAGTGAAGTASNAVFTKTAKLSLNAAAFNVDNSGAASGLNDLTVTTTGSGGAAAHVVTDLNAPSLAFGGSAANLTVTLPTLPTTAVNLAVTASSGDLTATNVKTKGGAVTLTASTGNLTASTINTAAGAISLTSTTGNVTASGLTSTSASPISLFADLGSTDLTLTGDVTVASSATSTKIATSLTNGTTTYNLTYASAATATAGNLSLTTDSTITGSATALLVPGTLTLRAGDTIGKTASLKISAQGAVDAQIGTGKTGDINLAQSGGDLTLTNAITGDGAVQIAVGGTAQLKVGTVSAGVATTGTGNVSLSTSDGNIVNTTVVGGITAGGTLDVTAGGALVRNIGTPASPLRINATGGATGLDASNGAIFVSVPQGLNFTDSVSTSKIKTTLVEETNTFTLNYSKDATDGNLGIVARTGNITSALGKNVQVGGELSLTAVVGSVGTGTAANARLGTSAGKLSATGNTGVFVSQLGDLALNAASTTTSGAVDITGTGDISVAATAAGPLSSLGDFNLNAAHTLSLSKNLGTIGGNASLTGGSGVTLAADVKPTGTVTVATTGGSADIVQSTGTVSGSTATFNSSNDVSQTGGVLSSLGATQITGGSIGIGGSVSGAGVTVTGGAVGVTGGVSAGTTITVTASGGITESAAGTITGGDVNLTATGGAINLSGSVAGGVGKIVTVQTKTAGTDLNQLAGTITGDTVNAIAKGDITGGGKISGGGLTLNAGGQIATVSTAVTSIDATAAKTIGITEDDGVTLKAVSTGSIANGAITVIAGNALPATPASLLIDTVTTAGAVTLTNKKGDVLNLDSTNSAINSKTSSTTVTSLTGDVGGGYNATFAKTSGGPLNIDSASGGAVSLNAASGSVAVNAAAGGAVSTTFDVTAAHVITRGTGQIYTLNAGQNVAIEVPGNLTDTGSVVLGIGANKVTLVSDGGAVGSMATPIKTDAVTITGSAATSFAASSSGPLGGTFASFGPVAAKGQIDLSTTGGVNLKLSGNLGATPADAVNVTASADLQQTSGIISGTTVTLKAGNDVVNGSIGDSLNRVQTSADTLIATGKGTGVVFVQQGKNVTLQSATSDTGDVNVAVTGTASGISVSTGGTGNATVTATVDATGGSVLAGALATVHASGNVNFGNISGGDADVKAGSNVNIGSVTATATATVVASGGSILSSGGTNITAATAILQASDSIGTSTTPLTTKVGSLSGALTGVPAVGDGIFITDVSTTVLTVTKLDASNGAPIHLTQTGADVMVTGAVNSGASWTQIDLAAGKTLTNSSNITGSTVTLVADLQALSTGTITGGTGVVTLKPTTANLGITLGGSNAGTLSLSNADLNTALLSGAGQLVIGSGGASGAGTISFVGLVNLTSAPQLSLITHQNVVDTTSGTAVFTGNKLAIVEDGGATLTGGVGSAVNPLDTHVGTLSVSSSGGTAATGGIFIANSGVATTVDTLTAKAVSLGSITSKSVVGVTTIAKNISLSNTTDATINSHVTTDGSGAISLVTSTAGDIAVKNDVTTVDGAITAQSAAQVIINSTGLLQSTATGAGNGNIVVTAPNAITMLDGGKILADAGTINLSTTSAAGDITLSRVVTNSTAGINATVASIIGATVADPTKANVVGSAITLTAANGIGSAGAISIATQAISASDTGSNPLGATGLSINLKSFSDQAPAPLPVPPGNLVTASLLSATGAGGIQFKQTGGQNLSVTSATTSNGNIAIDNTAALTTLASVVNVTAGTVSNVNGTVTVSSSGDVLAKTVTGSVDVTLKAGRDIAQADTITAGRDATLTSGLGTAGGIQFITVKAGQDFAASAPNAGNAKLTANGGSISGTSVTALRIADLEAAAGGITIGSVTAGSAAALTLSTGTVTLNAGGDINANSLQAINGVPLSTGGDVTVHNTGGSIFIPASGSLPGAAGSVLADGNATLTSDLGNITVQSVSVIDRTLNPSGISAGGDAMVLAHKNVSVDQVTAGNDVTITAGNVFGSGDLSFGTVSANNGNATLTANDTGSTGIGGNITGYNTLASKATPKNTPIGKVFAYLVADIEADANIAIGQVKAGAALLNAGSNVNAGTVDAGGDAHVFAGDTINTGIVTAGYDAKLFSGLNAATNPLVVGDINFGNITAGMPAGLNGDATLISTRGNITGFADPMSPHSGTTWTAGVSAQRTASLTADGNIDLSTVSGGDASLQAIGGFIKVDQVAANTLATGATHNATLQAQTDITVPNALLATPPGISALNDITVRAITGAVSITSTAIGNVPVSAGHDVTITAGTIAAGKATGGTDITISSALPSVSVSAGNIATLTATRDLSVDAVTAGVNATLTASSGKLTTTLVTATNNDVVLSAATDLLVHHSGTTAGNVTAKNTVTLTAGKDLTIELASAAATDLADGAQVNSLAKSVVLTAQNNLTAFKVTAAQDATLTATTGDARVVVATAQGGNAKITAGNDVVVAHDTGINGVTGGVVTGQVDARLDASNNINVELLGSPVLGVSGAVIHSVTGTAVLTAVNNITANQVLADAGDGSLTATNGNIVTNTVTAAHDATLAAGNDITVQHAFNSLTGATGAVSAANDATLTANRNITVELQSVAKAAGVSQGALVQGGHDATLTAKTGDVTAFAVTAQHAATLLAGTLNGAAAGGDVIATTVSAVTGNAVLTANRDVTVQHDDTVAATVTATAGDALLTATNRNLTVELASNSGGVGGAKVDAVVGNATLLAGDNLTAYNVHAGKAATLTAGIKQVNGDLAAVTVAAGTGAVLTASRDLSIQRDLTVAGSVVSTSGDVELTATNRDLTVQLASNSGGAGGAKIDAVSGNATLIAGNDLTAYNVHASQTGTLTAGTKQLAGSTGDVTAVTIATGGDATLTANRSINIQHDLSQAGSVISTSGDALLTATNGNLTVELASNSVGAGGAKVDAIAGKATLIAGNDLTAFNVHAGQVGTLTAGTQQPAGGTGDVTAVTIATGGNATLTANRSISIQHDLTQAGSVISNTGDALLTATNGNLTVELASVSSGAGGSKVDAVLGKATLLAGNDLTAYNVHAGQVGTLTAGTKQPAGLGGDLTAVTVLTGGDAVLTGSRDVSIQHDLTVAGSVTSNTGDASLTATHRNLTVELASNSSGAGGSKVDSVLGNATLLAGDNLTAYNVHAGLKGTLTAGTKQPAGLSGDLTAVAVATGLDAVLTASRNLNIQHDLGVAGSVVSNAGDALLTATHGNLVAELGSASGGAGGATIDAKLGKATLLAGVDATVNSVHGGGTVTITAGTQQVSGNGIGNLLAVTVASDGTPLPTVLEPVRIALSAKNDLTIKHDLSTQGTVIAKLGDITLDAGHDIVVELDADASPLPGGKIEALAGSVTLTAIHDLTAQTVIGSVDTKLTAKTGSLLVGAVTALNNDATLLGHINLTAGTVDAGRDASLTAELNDLTSQIHVNAGRDVSLTAGRDVLLKLVTVGKTYLPAHANLTAGRSIVDQNGLSVNIESPNQTGVSPILVAKAGATGSGDIELDTDVAKITATDSGTGKILLRSLRTGQDVELVDVSTAGGPITVTAVSQLTATKVVGNGGDTKLSNMNGDILVGLVESLGGTDRVASLTTTNRIEQVGATDGIANIISTGTIDLNAVSGIGSLGRIDVTAPTLLAATEGGNLTLHSIAPGPVTATLAVKSGAGFIDVLQDGGPLTVAKGTTFNGDITLLNSSGDLTLTKVAAGGAGNVFATTKGGSINVDSVSATGLTVNFDSASNITDLNGDGATNVTVHELKAKAVGFINLDTAVDNITAESTGAGDITFREVDAVTLDSVKTASGKVNVISGGTMTVKFVSAAGDATLETTGGDIQTDIVIAAGSLLKMTAAGSITDLNGDGVLNVTAHELRAKASGGINLDTALDNITAESTSHGDILFREVDAVTLDSVKTAGGKIDVTSGGTMTAKIVTASGGTLTLTTKSGDIQTGLTSALGNKAIFNAAGSITDLNGDGSINLSAADLKATAGGTINLDTALDTITAKAGGTIDLREVDAIELVSVTTSNAKINIHNAGRLLVDSVDAGSGEVDFTDNGGRIDPGTSPSGVNVVGSRLVTKSAGISVVPGTPLKTTIGTLVAESTGGDINLFNTGDFTVETLKFDGSGSLVLSAKSNDPKAGAANYGKISITQSGVSTQGTQAYNGNVVLTPLSGTSTASPFTFTAAGVTFNGTVDSDGAGSHRDLKTLTTGVAEFFGDVGAKEALASFQTGQDGSTKVHAKLTADGIINFNDDTTLTDAAAIHSGLNGAAKVPGILFGRKRTLTFAGPAGVKGTAPVPVTITTAGSNVAFQGSEVSTTNGAASVVTIGGDVNFDGPISSSKTGSVTLQVDTRLPGNNDKYGGNATLAMPAQVANLGIQAKNIDVFTVNAGGNITLAPDPFLRTASLPAPVGAPKGVQATQALVPAGTIRITGGNLTAGGNITLGSDRSLLNAGVSAAALAAGASAPAKIVAESATILSPVSLTIDASHGTFTMGHGEKLTVAPPPPLGAKAGTFIPAPTSLTIKANQAFLSDITVFGDLTVTMTGKNAAVINARPAQLLLNNQKDAAPAVGSVFDLGSDFFANGNITFNKEPVAEITPLGGDFLKTSVRFGTGIGVVSIGHLPFRYNNKAFEIDKFFANLQSFGGNTDLIAGTSALDATPSGPSNTVLTSVLAQAIPTDTPRPTDEENISGALKARLEGIGIYTRDLTTAEQTDRALGRILYLEVPTADAMKGAAGNQRYEVVGNRLPRKLAEAVVASFDMIYGRDPNTNQPISQEELTKAMNKVPNDLAEAYDAYMATLDPTTGKFDAAGFRDFLDSHKDYQELSTYLDRVQKVFSGVENLGLTDAQWSVARRNVVNQMFSGVSINTSEIIELIRTVSPTKRNTLARAASARAQR